MAIIAIGFQMLFILLTSNIIIQGITTMYKRIICFFLVVVLTISMFSFAASAEDHQHTFGEVENTIDLSGATMPNGDSLPLGLSITKSPCSTPGVDCDQVRYSWDFFGRKGSFVDDKNLPVAQVILHWYKWNEEFYGKNVGFDKLDTTNGGSNIPAAGGRNPKGYGDEGKADITASGVGVVWAEPFGISNSVPYRFSTTAPKDLIAGSSQSGVNWPSRGSSAYLVYTFTAPVTGLYFVGSLGDPYDYGTFNAFYDKQWRLTNFISKYGDYYYYSYNLTKGDFCYYSPTSFTINCVTYHCAYKYYLNKIPIYIEPLGDSSITTTNNITINNNTWNGNIYTDNSTNLTYIYPQYTTVNEKNETVTNISTNPIIYNNETKQYYTYDQTTKNYYYIYYGSDSPTPSPTPDPTPTQTPGGSGTGGGGDVSTPETGKPGGSSGSSWWDKLLSKIGDAILDGLLGAVSAVLKLIFKLFSTILSWIIWAVSRVFDLLPFLPPGLGGLLVGGVVVCFAIGIIKFIRG